MPIPPFSARNRGPHTQVAVEFPSTARIGLLHLLTQLVELEYVGGWIPVARELERIARVSPADYQRNNVSDMKEARANVENILSELAWDKVFDFCERLYSHLACAAGRFWNEDFEELVSRKDVQSHISDEIQRLFLEEALAYEFSNGIVRRRGRQHTIDVTTRAQVVLGDPKLANARRHFTKAISFFQEPIDPDFENVVKEAVCAAESAGKALFPEAKSRTLDDLARWFTDKKKGVIPPALVKVITAIYAFRNGGEGVSHGHTSGGIVTAEIAEFVLAVCASQIIYFVDIQRDVETKLPF